MTEALPPTVAKAFTALGEHVFVGHESGDVVHLVSPREDGAVRSVVFSPTPDALVSMSQVVLSPDSPNAEVSSQLLSQLNLQARFGCFFRSPTGSVFARSSMCGLDLGCGDAVQRALVNIVNDSVNLAVSWGSPSADLDSRLSVSEASRRMPEADWFTAFLRRLAGDGWSVTRHSTTSVGLQHQLLGQFGLSFVLDQPSDALHFFALVDAPPMNRAPNDLFETVAWLNGSLAHGHVDVRLDQQQVGTRASVRELSGFGTDASAKILHATFSACITARDNAQSVLNDPEDLDA